MSIEWYAVHTYVGHEDKVRENVMQRARSLGMADMVYQVVVPSEEAMEHRDGGKQEVVKRKLFPGYVFVQMDPGDNPDEPNEAWEWYVILLVSLALWVQQQGLFLYLLKRARILGTVGIMG
ncbi:MAG: transcription termination/antitermination NusG family protein [Deinococcales bacterium]